MHNMSEDSMFKDYAEVKVKELIDENQVILNRLHVLEFAAEEMSRDPKMTAKAWRRVIKGYHNSRKKQVKENEMKYEHPIEEAMVKNLRNQLGIVFQMAVKNEEMMEVAKRELANMRKIAEDRQKAAMEAAQNQESFKFESVESTDDQKGDK